MTTAQEEQPVVKQAVTCILTVCFESLVLSHVFFLLSVNCSDLDLSYTAPYPSHLTKPGCSQLLYDVIVESVHFTSNFQGEQDLVAVRSCLIVIVDGIDRRCFTRAVYGPSHSWRIRMGQRSNLHKSISHPVAPSCRTETIC